MVRLLYFALLLSSTIAIGQDLQVDKSEIFKDRKTASILEFAVEDVDGGLVTIRSYRGSLSRRTKGYYIDHYDSDLKLQKNLDYPVKDITIKNAFIKNGILNLIQLEANKKAKRFAYSVTQYDLKDYRISTDRLLNFPPGKAEQFFGSGIYGWLLTSRGEDDNHLGSVKISKYQQYFAINIDVQDKKREIHKIYVYDTDLNLLFEKTIRKNVEDRLFEYNTFEIDDDDGSIYFLGKAYPDGRRKKRKRDMANYHFELTRVDPEGESTIRLESGENFIESMQVVLDGEAITCVGFYGENREELLHGVCAFDLDIESLEIKSSTFSAFTDQFLTDKYGDRKRRKKRAKRKGLGNIVFRNIEILDNGDISLTAEEYFVTTRTVNTGVGATGGMRTETLYYFNDIIALRLNKDRSLKWARTINKTQEGLDITSYTALSMEESTYIFINCSDRINRLRDDRIEFRDTNAKRSNLYMIHINGEGGFDYQSIVDDKDSKVYYKVNSGVANSLKGTVILVGDRKKLGRILRVTI